MDETAVFNRSLWDVTGLAREVCQRNGDVACASRERMPARGSIAGRGWVGGHLMPKEFWPFADFNTYATRWEQRYSVLTPEHSRLRFVPVVGEKSRLSFPIPSPLGAKVSALPVIGHHGTASVTDIIVLKKYATDAVGDARRAALEGLLDQGIEAYVEENYPPYGNWGSFSLPHNIGPNNFTLLTDPDGRILACLNAYGSEPGLESEDPLSYLAIGAAVVKLATVGGKVVFRMVSQRVARKAEELAAKQAAKRAAINEIRSVSREELKTVRGGAPGTKPPLLRGDALTKPVPQIRPGMGAKVVLSDAEQAGVRDIMNVLERYRLNPQDESILRQLGDRRVKAMRFGSYAKQGWKEIDVLPGNTGWNNTVRVIYRVVNGDVEAKLLQVHGGGFSM